MTCIPVLERFKSCTWNSPFTLFLGGLIFGKAYIRREICVSNSGGLICGGAYIRDFTVLHCYSYIWNILSIDFLGKLRCPKWRGNLETTRWRLREKTSKIIWHSCECRSPLCDRYCEGFATGDRWYQQATCCWRAAMNILSADFGMVFFVILLLFLLDAGS